MTTDNSSTGTLPTSKASDPTFRNYAPSQAQNYAKHRGGYPPQLISKVIEFHTSTSPDPSTALTTVVDVGCGPGMATRDLAPYFSHAVGVDPGESMIATAQKLGGTTRSGEEIQYAVTSAETIDQGLLKLGIWNGNEAEPSVDLITAATAAHWFDLPLFYSAAAKVLKPGGSIIIWGSGSSYIDKRKYPADVADRAQEIMIKFDLEVLKEYELEGTRIAREMYQTIVLPWDLEPGKRKELGLEVFDQDGYLRKTWNEGGKIEEDVEGGWMRGMDLNWQTIKMILGTASHVTRFREQNKQALESGEVEDPVDVLIRSVREVLGPDVETCQGGVSTGMVMLKKKQ